MNVFCHTVVHTSSIVPAPVQRVWEVIRDFGSVSDWVAPVGFASFHSELMPGHIEGQVGCRRIVTLDGRSYVQELTALDDDEHIQRYKLVAHPGALNPFPYSLINYSSCLACREVTLDNTTFFEWTGEFETDLEGVAVMQRAVQSQMESGMRCLCDYFKRMAAASQQNLIGVSGGSATRAAPESQQSQMFRPGIGSGSYHGALEDAYDGGDADPGLQAVKATGKMTLSGGSHVSTEEMSGMVQGLRLSSQSEGRTSKSPQGPLSGGASMLSGNQRMNVDAGGSPRFSSRGSQAAANQQWSGPRSS